YTPAAAGDLARAQLHHLERALGDPSVGRRRPELLKRLQGARHEHRGVLDSCLHLDVLPSCRKSRRPAVTDDRDSRCARGGSRVCSGGLIGSTLYRAQEAAGKFGSPVSLVARKQTWPRLTTESGPSSPGGRVTEAAAFRRGGEGGEARGWP